MDCLIRQLSPGLSDCQRARWLRAMHAATAFAILAVFLGTTSRTVRYVLMGTMLVIVLIQFVCRGCPLSRLERWLCPDKDINVVDPLLWLFGLPRNRKMRLLTMLLSSSGYLLLMTAVLVITPA